MLNLPGQAKGWGTDGGGAAALQPEQLVCLCGTSEGLFSSRGGSLLLSVRLPSSLKEKPVQWLVCRFQC